AVRSRGGEEGRSPGVVCLAFGGVRAFEHRPCELASRLKELVDDDSRRRNENERRSGADGAQGTVRRDELAQELPASVPVGPDPSTRDEGGELPGELLGVSIAVRWPGLKRSLGDGSEFGRCTSVDYAHRVELPCAHVLENLIRGGALEGRAAGEHLVEDCSEAEDVAPGIDGRKVAPGLL